MIRNAALGLGLIFFASAGFAAQDVAHAVDGTVKSIDTHTKTVVVDTADGTEHTFHYIASTSVHGADDTAKASVDSYHGLKDGSKVAVHYTAVGSRETAREFDNIGDDGLKAAKGTVSHVDHAAKTITVKTEDGSEETYHFTDRAARDTGKDVAAGAEKSTKVTVYYTEDAGKKTAHFIKREF